MEINSQCMFYLQSLEYVRLSRGELDRREQAISTLRYLQLAFRHVVIMVAGDTASVGTFFGPSANWIDCIYLICRVENLKLQAKIRELEQGAENYTVVSNEQLDSAGN